MTSGLPVTLPIFPLEGALMLPGTVLPLNIFEPRYLAMVRDALEQTSTIGMIQPKERETPGKQQTLYSIGCVGRIAKHGDTLDGRIMITLLGEVRFRIVRELEVTTPYRQVVPQYLEVKEDADEVPPYSRDEITSLLKRFLDALDLSADADALSDVPDDRLVDALSIACPFDAREKQALLECNTATDRAEMLMALMAFAIRAGDTDNDELPLQ